MALFRMAGLAFGVVAAAGFLLSGDARAVEKAEPQCGILPEAVVRLPLPNFEAGTHWRAVVKSAGMDRFRRVAVASDGMVIAAGEAQAPADPDALDIMLVKLDARRGKVVWKQRYPHPGNDTVEGLAILPDGRIVVAGTYSLGGLDRARLAWFSENGSYQSDRMVEYSGHNLLARDLAATRYGEGLILAAWARDAAHPEKNFGVLYRISPNGVEDWRRAYMPGVPNQFRAIRVMPDGDFVVAGDVADETGRMVGWVLRVAVTGVLEWQRALPRGEEAYLSAVAPYSGSGFVAVGSSLPTDGGPRAGWAVRVKEDGEPVWQRFYTGSYAFAGQDVLISSDGRAVALFNATPSQEEDAGREHVRLLTLSPEGATLSEASVIEGAGSSGAALGRDLIGRWVMVGATQSGTAKLPTASEAMAEADSVPPPPPLEGYESWAVSMPVLSKWKNPCTAARRR